MCGDMVNILRNKIYGRHSLRIAVGLTMLALLLLAGSAGAVPVEEWNKTFGGTYDDEAYAVQQTSDGGYIIVGYTMHSPGNDDALLIKTDASGNQQWSKTYGGNGVDAAYSVQQTSDGGYILAGSTSSFGAGSTDFWLIKTDANGNQQWSRTFAAYSVQQTSDGPLSDPGQALARAIAAHSVQQTSDGGYILAGGNVKFIKVIKTDANGNQQWNKTFNGTGITAWAYSAQQTSDSGYILLGTATAGGLLIKTDANGNEQWNETSLGNDGYTVYSVQQTMDAGYILAGYMWAAGKVDALIIKTDANGNEVWNKTFGGASYDEARSVYQTSDGGYILAGHTKSYGLVREAWLIKIREEHQPAETTIVPTVSMAEKAELTQIPTAIPTEKTIMTEVPTAGPTEKATGFEVVLSITIFSAIYLLLRKRK